MPRTADRCGRPGAGIFQRVPERAVVEISGDPGVARKAWQPIGSPIARNNRLFGSQGPAPVLIHSELTRRGGSRCRARGSESPMKPSGAGC
jgi:hypothetical protein